MEKLETIYENKPVEERKKRKKKKILGLHSTNLLKKSFQIEFELPIFHYII